LIDKISCGLDVTKSKPDPEVFLVAASKLELDPSVCLVVEDAAAGVEAAKAGGMKSLGVGPFHAELGADFHSRTLATVDNWEEIL
jgi:beta-phosphoglucomutase